MKKLLLILLLAIIFALWWAASVSAQTLPPRNAVATAACIKWLMARQTIREATGRNDGPAVAALVKAGGGDPSIRPEWCGFTQAACQKANGLPIPGAGMQGAARAWFPKEGLRTTYLVGVRGTLDVIGPGDLVGFDYGRGIHHVARCKEVVPALRKGRPPRAFYTLAGNEGRGTNAGLHLTYYAAPNIDAAARWDFWL
jgi:hypothetical protein